MSSLIGKRLQGGKYKLEKVLGRGGFGLTFRAHQTYLDQVVVVKTLNESFWSAPNLNDLQRQFQDEARRLALCSHPNVVRVSDFFIEDNLPYMVMDYIPGKSLADMVSPDKVLPEATAVSYVQQIGKALQAVHSKGLLHRDVKPQNIMIHELTGEAVLIDFGIARELTQNPAQTHTSIVSEGYAPIEQYMPKAQRSAATDIYGLAATLYTLLTGATPVAAVLRDRTPMPTVQTLRPDVSDAVGDAIAHGMKIELKDRPQSVGRWITSLTQKSGTQKSGGTGVLGRTTRNQETQAPTVQSPSGFSSAPTRVVAPGQPTYASSPPAATTNKTVAMPIPTAYGTEHSQVYAPRAQPRAERKGCGCASTLGILTVGIVGAFAGGGFWLFQQLNGGVENLFADFSLPKLELPSAERANQANEDTVDGPKENPDEENTEENLEEPEDEVNAEKLESEILEEQPVEQSVDVVSGEPPLLLTNDGDPANAQPGHTGGMVAIPGFSPGDSANEIRGRLGEPTQSSSVNGYETSIYDVVPNRVSLAYVYEPGSNQVRQSEATFSPATDRLVMRTALVGILDGRSTREIEQGLEAVRTGERDRFDFDQQGFRGAIERNAYGYVHIYVQN
ncbi:MAG: serine/threonine-protein kinase [Cyanobacteria bacterium P01_F01_bin.53]